MSAAEPANPTPAYPVNNGAGAAVIPLTKHRSRGVRNASRGWRATMTPPESPAGPPGAGDSHNSLTQFAQTIELGFLEIGRSLSEPDTASVFQVTLNICQRALEGSQATGIINADQLAELSTVIEGMRQAPRLV